ncbi:hypothetical protein VSR82_39470 [Burkholderia sp. JPY481]
MAKLPRGVLPRPQLPALTLSQMSLRFDTAELQGMSAAQRARVITHLAKLLLQGAGVAIGKESDDDDR